MSKRKSLFQRFLNGVEVAGNALPHPATLFLIFALLALLASWIGKLIGWEVIHPGSGEVVAVKNLLSVEGLHYILENTVTNFTDFAPLGIVLVAMLGIGVAERSGLIGVVIRLLVISTPKKLLTFVIVLAGIISNMASSVGYVLLIPLAGIIFISVKRHPIAGMAAAFAGVSGGFSANLAIGSIDPLLAGISQEAAHLVDPTYHVNPTANYYFMVVSTFLIAFIGTWITEKIVEPRLGEYKPADGEIPEEIDKLSRKEKLGILYSFAFFLVSVGVMVWGLVPEDGFLRGPEGSALKSPLLKGVVTALFIITAIMGIIYGFTVGKFKSDADVMKSMSESMKTLAAYLVLVFFAAQFVKYFSESNLGMITAVKGATLLKAANVNKYVLIILFVIFAAFLNMLMGSASAKWAILAPVFVPIFMLLELSPELSQVVFRIGDSVTNIISPMMSFFALIIAYFQKYDKESGIGTIISTMLPYSLIFFLAWTGLLLLWVEFGLPLGPGSGLFYGG